MKTKRAFFLIALLIAGSISAHAGGLIEMFTGGKDRGPQTNGKVTVRGLSKYEGKFVMGIADSDPALLAAGNITSDGVVTAGAVKGGKAALKVWQGSYGAYGGFDGNDALSLLLAVYDREAPGGAVAMGLVEVNFKKGKGSGTGAFIAGSAFSGSMGSIADSFFAETIARSNNASGGDLFGDLLGILGSGILGGNANAVGEILGSGGSSAGLFSRIGSFFSGLFGGGKSAASSNVEELKARILAGDIAALQVLGELAQAGNRDALNAMTEIVAAAAVTGDFNLEQLYSGGQQAQTPARTQAPPTQGGGSMTWTAVEDSTFGTDEIRAIAYGNNKFVAGGRYGKMAYSSDGVNWIAVADNTFDDIIGNSQVYAIAYGNNTFVAGGYPGRIVYSSDGETWTAVADSTFGTGSYSQITAIAFGNNRFVAGAIDGRMATSPDGVTWTQVTDSTFDMAAIYAIAYGNNRFVAVGTGGRMAYSPDGVTWTAVADREIWLYGQSFGINAYVGINAIAYDNNKFVAGGGRGKMATSPDGLTWTAVADSTFGINYGIQAIAYGNNRWVAVGEIARMATSPDGVNWTAVSGPYTSGHINGIAYGNGRFVAVGQAGKMAYSNWP